MTLPQTHLQAQLTHRIHTLPFTAFRRKQKNARSCKTVTAPGCTRSQRTFGCKAGAGKRLQDKTQLLYKEQRDSQHRPWGERSSREKAQSGARSGWGAPPALGVTHPGPQGPRRRPSGLPPAPGCWRCSARRGSSRTPRARSRRGWSPSRAPGRSRGVAPAAATPRRPGSAAPSTSSPGPRSRTARPWGPPHPQAALAAPAPRAAAARGAPLRAQPCYTKMAAPALTSPTGSDRTRGRHDIISPRGTGDDWLPVGGCACAVGRLQALRGAVDAFSSLCFRRALVSVRPVCECSGVPLSTRERQLPLSRAALFIPESFVPAMVGPAQPSVRAAGVRVCSWCISLGGERNPECHNYPWFPSFWSSLWSLVWSQVCLHTGRHVEDSVPGLFFFRDVLPPAVPALTFPAGCTFPPHSSASAAVFMENHWKTSG